MDQTDQLIAYWADSIQSGVLRLRHGLRYSMASRIPGKYRFETVLPPLVVDALRMQHQVLNITSKYPTQVLKIVIAPWYAQASENHESVYAPCLLIAELSNKGTIDVKPNLAFPSFPTLLAELREGYPITLADSDLFEQYYSLFPPAWIEQPELLTWENQIDYARSVIESVTKGAWKWHLNQARYDFQDAMLIFPLQGLLQPLQQAEYLLLAQLQNAALRTPLVRQVLRGLHCDAEAFEEPQSQEVAQPSIDVGTLMGVDPTIAFSAEQLRVLHQGLEVPAGAILKIAAERGVGKSLLIKTWVATAWTKAAISEKNPERIVWVRDQQNWHYATIFDCFDDSVTWVRAQDRRTLSQSSLTPSSSATACIEYYLQQATHYLSQPIDHLEQAKNNLHQKLSQQYEVYEKGLSIARRWAVYQHVLEKKYYRVEKLYEKIQRVKTLAQEAEYRVKQLGILYGLWQRKVSALPKWPKYLSAIPGVRKHWLKKINIFFRDNFPECDIHQMNITELQIFILQQIKQCEKQQISTKVQLSKLQAESQQLVALQQQAKEWLHRYLNQTCTAVTLPEYQLLLINRFGYEMVQTALHYWEAKFLQITDWSYQRGYLQDCYYDTVFPDKVDLLIIEKGELLDPMFAICALQCAKHSIVFGRKGAMHEERVSPQHDYLQALNYRLISDDVEFEEQHYLGVLASTGNLWQMLTHADYADLDTYPYLQQQWTTARVLGTVYNHLQGEEYAKALQVTSKKPFPSLGYQSIQGKSEGVLGSRVNVIEIQAVLTWLQEHGEALKAWFRVERLTQAIQIVTTTKEQLNYFESGLAQDPTLSDIAVRLLQQADLPRAKAVIFSPVSVNQDERPFCFEQGVEVLAHLVACAEQHLWLFGDMTIFKDSSHSATGKFAESLHEYGGDLAAVQVVNAHSIITAE